MVTTVGSRTILRIFSKSRKAWFTSGTSDRSTLKATASVAASRGRQEIQCKCMAHSYTDRLQVLLRLCPRSRVHQRTKNGILTNLPKAVDSLTKMERTSYHSVHSVKHLVWLQCLRSHPCKNSPSHLKVEMETCRGHNCRN